MRKVEFRRFSKITDYTCSCGSKKKVGGGVSWELQYRVGRGKWRKVDEHNAPRVETHEVKKQVPLTPDARY